MGLTLNDIEAAENAVKNVRVVLQGIGRELYKMREGVELGPEYGFEGYRRQNFCGPEYADQEGPDWGVGTPIFSLQYYWPRGENTRTVTFPMGWLERDWRKLETERLEEERRAAAEAERVEREEAALALEASELRTYRELKAKFEPQDSEPRAPGK